MPKFPIDAPSRKVIKALEQLGFSIVREKEHISMIRRNPDGTANTAPVRGSGWFETLEAEVTPGRSPRVYRRFM